MLVVLLTLITEKGAPRRLCAPFLAPLATRENAPDRGGLPTSLGLEPSVSALTLGVDLSHRILCLTAVEARPAWSRGTLVGQPPAQERKPEVISTRTAAWRTAAGDAAEARQLDNYVSPLVPLAAGDRLSNLSSGLPSAERDIDGALKWRLR